MKKNLITIAFIYLTVNLFSQNSFVDSVINPIQKNQLFLEKVFIHTNKDFYSSSDVIWFKAYIVDRDNKPSLKTTLLYVNLLNKKGELVATKNVLIKDGVGVNQFELTSNINNNAYYIQAYTNYMRNYGEDKYFIKKIYIGNKKSKKSKKEYEVQVFPEGGCFVENVKNNLGIKVTENEHGINYKGKIIESSLKEIASFNESYDGMSKASFLYEKGKEYKVKIYLKDTILNLCLPRAKKTGVVINLDNKKDSIKIKIKTNFKDLKKEDKYILLFHNFNKLLNYFELNDLKNNEIKTIIINKKRLPKGVNTITLFKNNKPISERKFFVEKNNFNSTAQLKKIREEKDSVTYDLILSDVKGRQLEANISISVLLDKQQKFIPSKNIIESFNLTPYVKSHVEEPVYYFDKSNIKRREHLDLLLLSQKKNINSLKEMISNLNPKYKYNFELGFNLKGSLSPVITNKLALISSKDELIDKINLIGKKNKFDFKKLLLYKGDTVKISFLKNDEAILPKIVKLDSLKEFTYPKINRSLKYTPNKPEEIKYKDTFNLNNIRLDEVEVKGKRLSKARIKKKNFVKKHKKTVFDIGMYYPLNINREKETDLMSFLLIEEGIILKNWKGVENYLSYGVKREALLYIDGKRIKSNELSSIFIKMNNIEDIGITIKDKVKFIQVFTTENYKKNIQNLFKQFIIENGYDKGKRYFSPTLNYNSINSLQELDWKPILKTDKKDDKISFKIRKNEYLEEENIVFYIQGVSKEGVLINHLIRF